MLFGLPFIIAGLAVGAFLYFSVLSNWWSARGWVEVPCWIEDAALKTSRGRKSTTFEAKASYRYEFERRTYHSEEVSLSGGSDNMGDFHQAAFRQIQESKARKRPFRCFVNPANPAQAVLFRDLRWGLLLMMSIFPTLFPLAGFTVAIGGWLQMRKARSLKELALQHPGEPWRWRREWAGDAIQASKDGLPYILAIAGWILAVQLPLVLAMILGGEMTKSAFAWLALLPALLALIPLGVAWRRIQSRRAIGRPCLKLKKLPLSPGHALAGELQFDRVPSPLSGLSVCMRCQRHITRRSGDSRTTAKETLWEHTEALSATGARRDINGVTLPLHIKIPRGLPASAMDEDSIVTTDGEQHVWTLEISSAQGGKPAVLPLPVFASNHADDETESVPHEEEAPAILSTDDLVTRLRVRSIHAAFGPDGLPTLIDCPAGRFRSTGIFLLVFGTIWSVAFGFMTFQNAPLIFRLVWGITSPLIIGGALWTLLHGRRVEIAGDKLRILNRLGSFYSWSETFEPRHFTGFTHDTNMQSGNQFYYRVRAETIFGKKKTLIDGVTESITAETLAQRLEEWQRGAIEAPGKPTGIWESFG